MKKIIFCLVLLSIFLGLGLKPCLAQPPWSDIPIRSPKKHKDKSKEKGRLKLPKREDRTYKDYKTKQQEYKNFYSVFLNNDGTIDKVEMIFLNMKRAELGLTKEEAESLEFIVKLESPIVFKKD
jgi:hypothetical protein